MLLEISLGLVLYILYFYWKENVYRRHERPPGPLRLPILGNLHQIAATGKKLPFMAFDVLSKSYGPIMSLKMGVEEAAVISSLEEMNALFTRDECIGRIIPKLLESRSHFKNLGVVFSSGDEWKEVRRFTIKSLREFGFGKKLSMELIIQEELHDFVARLKEKIDLQNGLMNANMLFHLSILNVIWIMVAGRKFSSDDSKILQIMDLVDRGMKLGNFGSDLSLAFPFLLRLFPNFTGVTFLKNCWLESEELFQGILDEYRERGSYESDPDCFIDVCIQKIQSEQSNQAKLFTDEQIIVVLMDLFQTGSETVSSTLSYGILFMILNPEVQRKVREEIDQYVSRNEDIRYALREKMIYTQATILEFMRLGYVVPLIPPRKVLTEFTYKGYRFPKDMSLIANLHSIYADPVNFKEPHKFMPERFIDQNNRIIENSVSSSCFGFGKRLCLGDTLAQTATFIFFTTMLKHFEFSAVPNEPLPSTAPVPGFTISPQHYNMIVKVRE